MVRDYDIVIVGAGPAGLLAAKSAALSGASVAVLERKAEIDRLNRLCGQTLVSVNDYYFDDLVYYRPDSKTIGFINEGISFPYTGSVKHSYAWHIYSPDGNPIMFGDPVERRTMGDCGAVAISCDKEILFRNLIDDIRMAGAEIFSGIDVVNIEKRNGGLRVHGSNTEFHCKYTIAADGTNSRVARMLGFNEHRTFYCYLLCKGFYIRDLKLPADDILISAISYSQKAPGFMFIFPRAYQGEATVAFLALEPGVNLDLVANYFMNENRFFAGWFQGSEKIKEFASSQYIYSPVEAPYKDRVLLAGDSGSCQELENTGAMISGWKAGAAIAATLHENRFGIEAKAIKRYLDWWDRTYIKGCSHEDYLMNFVLPYVIDKEPDLNYIFSLVKKPLPACWNPYEAVRLMGGLIQGLVPEIQKARPEIMPKLGRMSQPMIDILQEATQRCMPVKELE